MGLYDYWIVLKLSGNERSGNETNIAEKTVLEYAHFPHTLPQAVVLLEPQRGEPPRRFIDSHCPPLHQSLPHSFEATRDACRAARHNLVTVGVEDLKGNCISEGVPVNTDLDGAGESVCLYPDPGGAKNEGVGDRAVIVALGVPPGTQTGRG